MDGGGGMEPVRPSALRGKRRGEARGSWGRRPSRGSRWLGLVCVAFLGLAASPAPASAQSVLGPEASRLVRQAAALEASGDLEGAEGVLRQVLALEPRATSALFALERVLRSRGEPTAILRVVDAFLSLDPTAGQVRVLKLRVLQEADSLQALRREAEAWVDADPAPATYRDVLPIYEAAFGTAEAMAFLRAGRSGTGDAALLALEFGDLSLRAGDPAAAVREWTEGIGDDGSQVPAVARRLRELERSDPDRGVRAVTDVLAALSASPVFARRRAAAWLAVELRAEERALPLAQRVAAELGGRGRTAFLTEVGDRARESALAALAAWAYDELGEEARTPAERRVVDVRLVEAALASGDTAAAFQAQSRIAASFPEGSAERRQALVQLVRLGVGTLESAQLARAFDAFVDEYPTASEIDELAASIARLLRQRGDQSGALAVLESAAGARSRVELGFLLLGEGRVEDGREVLEMSFEVMQPGEATGVIRLVGLLGRLSPPAATLLAEAASAARHGDPDGPLERLAEPSEVRAPAERAILLAEGARLAEDSGRPVRAVALRTLLLERYPDDPAAPEATLALARHHASSGARAAAVTLLETLLSRHPGDAVAPSARAELERLRGSP